MDKIAFFDTHGYEKTYYQNLSTQHDLSFEFFETRLDKNTINLCREDHLAVCSFVNDSLDKEVLEEISKRGIGLVSLRSAGYNHVDMTAANELGIKVCRVPSYSPHSVAEFTLAQMLCLTRKIHRSYSRTREMNFSLDGLVGMTIAGKTVGVAGTGKIGRALIHLLNGFKGRVLAYDLQPDPEIEKLEYCHYADLDQLITQSDIISLHVPLVPETQHFLNGARIQSMKDGVLIINTGRGGLIDTAGLVQGLKSKKIGGAALDVYEEEDKYFFQDFSGKGIEDDQLARLLTFPNVIITSHQGFLTEEALDSISQSVIESIDQFRQGKPLVHQIGSDQ